MLQYVGLADANDSTLFPVVLFVHADSYDVGTGNAYDGSVLAAFGHLVVVTFNFRLGALGMVWRVRVSVHFSSYGNANWSCINVAAATVLLSGLAFCRVEAITTVLCLLVNLWHSAT